MTELTQSEFENRVRVRAYYLWLNGSNLTEQENWEQARRIEESPDTCELSDVKPVCEDANTVSNGNISISLSDDEEYSTDSDSDFDSDMDYCDDSDDSIDDDMTHIDIENCKVGNTVRFRLHAGGASQTGRIVDIRCQIVKFIDQDCHQLHLSYKDSEWHLLHSETCNALYSVDFLPQ